MMDNLNTNQNKARVAILISDTINFRAKNSTRDIMVIECHYIVLSGEFVKRK